MYRDRYGGPESLFDDMDSYPDGLSLMGMVGSQVLTEGDWDIVALMEKLYSPCSLAEELDSQNPLRCEAILHAWPNDPLDELANTEWAQPYLARWPAVEALMDGLAPTTWTHEAMGTWRALPKAPREKAGLHLSRSGRHTKLPPGAQVESCPGAR
jgi:hypothetical protein